MKAYSQDLRERVASACAEPGAKIYQVAVRFAVLLAFTNKLLRRQRTSGTVVLDNLSVHKVAGLDEIAQKYGVRLLYLPPYLPDFNPHRAGLQ